ncbi:MAG TPA: MBL fold metallo-hydrolase [Candidatus Cloacimonadota bacterium]|nr:MBL fold metallo-hydrolase [Candidatus Cloacimonadota bacterium]
MKLGRIEISPVSAGYYWSDGGAAFGALPKVLWNKTVEADEKNRIRFQLSLLLIRADGRNILIDTGCGNHLNEKQIKIYSPSEFILFQELDKLGLSRYDITDVILTHLHFDHAGGVISIIDGKRELTFPNAIHHIQRKEWNMAENPDELNQAAYMFEEQLSLLASLGKYRLIDGLDNLTPEIQLRLTGGHTVGTQVVCMESEGEFAVYAGDIIPSQPHLSLPVISAYDVSREDTFRAKKSLLSEIRSKNGILLLNHDAIEFVIKV